MNNIMKLNAGKILLTCIFKKNYKLNEKYNDVAMNFEDDCLVYLAEKLQLNMTVTIDRDFYI